MGYVGYYTPFLVMGSAIFTIGGGLFITMDGRSNAGEYIGYQVLLGIGQGICIQIPVITAQAFAAPEDVPTATTIILCKSIASTYRSKLSDRYQSSR